ncbi:MAG: tRNA 2-thiouridine(34) synthase MnmA [Phycisphaerae bacterium]|nr:tRNA 2-thiouridine(34) synthase MnmA [Phycisphaerae bacterium]
MTKKQKVLIAMSGGVDSSAAAGLLVQQGYDVIGVFMCLGQAEKTNEAHPGCCSPLDAADAREVAQILGIPFHVLNFQKDLDKIIKYFVDEYRHARTPNPCIMCNSNLKFGKLMDFAKSSDCDFVATGHYAQVKEIDGIRQLFRGTDNNKDQSYALFGMGLKNLQHVMLPIGQYEKAKVRKIAEEFSLPVHNKSESQEICFVPDDDYASLICKRVPELDRPGNITNTEGKILGRHNGIFRYTIGQRRGLGVALGEPAYVVKLDAESNTVVLGNKDDLCQKNLEANRLTWMTNDVPTEPFEAIVQIRYNHRGAPAKVYPNPDNTVKVEFDESIPAITPGQAVVFFDNQKVIGGGWIEHGF